MKTLTVPAAATQTRVSKTLSRSLALLLLGLALSGCATQRNSLSHSNDPSRLQPVASDTNETDRNDSRRSVRLVTLFWSF